MAENPSVVIDGGWRLRKLRSLDQKGDDFQMQRL